MLNNKMIIKAGVSYIFLQISFRHILHESRKSAFDCFNEKIVFIKHIIVQISFKVI